MNCFSDRAELIDKTVGSLTPLSEMEHLFSAEITHMLPFWQHCDMISFFISLVVNMGILWILLLPDVMYNDGLEWSRLKTHFAQNIVLYSVDARHDCSGYIDDVQFRTLKSHFRCIV